MLESSDCEFPQDVLKAATETILNDMRQGAERLKNRLLRRRKAILRGCRLRGKRFEERLYGIWAEPLDYYELCLYLAQNCGAFFNKSYGSQASLQDDPRFYALVRLHAAATRVAGEIYALLLSGYASGAYARWRTLHETSVTAMFIAQETNEIAQRYIHHQHIKNYEDAKVFLRYEPSVVGNRLVYIEKVYRELLQEYGNDFRRPYGWAHSAIYKRIPSFKGERIGFEHLQAAVQIENWSPWYRIASHSVHPSAASLDLNVRLGEEGEMLLAGRCDSELSDPGQGAVISLVGASEALLGYRQDNVEDENVFQNMNANVTLTAMVTALRDLSELTVDAFAKAYDTLEKETD